jgi:hypothetical protein
MRYICERKVSGIQSLKGTDMVQRVAEADKLLRVCDRIAFFMSRHFTNLMTKEQKYKSKFIITSEY